MPIYEYQGQQYEISTEDPAEAKAKILKHLASGGETKIESKMPKPVEGEGGAAFGVYRPAGRRPESQNLNREENKEMALQTARGAVSNIPAVAGIPGSVVNTVANLPRTAQDLYNRYQRAISGSEAPLPELPPEEKVTPYWGELRFLIILYYFRRENRWLDYNIPFLNDIMYQKYYNLLWNKYEFVFVKGNRINL